MSFETISLLLNWMEMGVLLAILFRLSYTFDLIANTQRELRRAIHHLGERSAAQLGANSGFDRPEFARRAPDHSERTIHIDDLAREIALKQLSQGYVITRARWDLQPDSQLEEAADALDFASRRKLSQARRDD